MKAHSFFCFMVVFLLIGAGPLRTAAAPLGTQFTYQGRLVAGGSPANGLFDLRLTLFDSNTGGTPVGGAIPVVAAAVSNGLFTTSVDFGAGIFDGTSYWLEVAVRPSGTANPFRTLSPRQRMSGTPYALFAANADSAFMAGSVPWSGLTGVPPGFADGVDNDTTYTAGAGLILTGTDFSLKFDGSGSANSAARSDHTHSASDITSGLLPDARLEGTYSHPLSFSNRSNRFAGDGSDLSLVDAVTLGGRKPERFWQLDGNAGITPGVDFLGTTDSRPLELRVGNSRALLLDPRGVSPNVVGGYQGNFISTAAVGGTIAGGGTANDGTGQARTNRVTASYGTIGGGFGHAVGAGNATIAGGELHTIEVGATDSTIGGGQTNSIQRGSRSATIGGGLANAIQTNSSFSTIGGGRQNIVPNGVSYASIPGGYGAAVTSYGQSALASGPFAIAGDAQTSVYVLRNTSTNAAITELFLDGISERIKIPLNGRWAFVITVVASTPGPETGAWQIRGVIRNLAGVTMVLPGSPNIESLGGEGNAGWGVNASADPANGALIVRVIGPQAGVARWVATVRTTELIF